MKLLSARKYFFSIAAALLLLPLSYVHAADATSGLTNPLGDTKDLSTLLTKILAGVVQIGGVVVTLMLVYCGFLFVVAQGNEEKIREARTALLWTVIGALVLLGAAALQAVIASTVTSLTT